MDGFIDGYMSKTAEEPVSMYQSFMQKLRATHGQDSVKRLQQASALYGTDDDASSLFYLDQVRGKPIAVQQKHVQKNPQHLMRVLNTAKVAKPGENPYKNVKAPGFGKSTKARAGWGLYGHKFLDDTAKNLTPEALSSTYNLRKAPNAGK